MTRKELKQATRKKELKPFKLFKREGIKIQVETRKNQLHKIRTF